MMPNEIEYTRLDKRILHDVYQALKNDKRVASFELRIGVLNAVVHLTGEVPSLQIWELVQEIAARIPDVRGVVNRIEAPGAPEPARTIHLDLKPQDFYSDPDFEKLK